jgi:hypothetical protein
LVGLPILTFFPPLPINCFFYIVFGNFFPIPGSPPPPPPLSPFSLDTFLYPDIL